MQPEAAARRRNHALWLGPLAAAAGFLSYYTFFVRFPTLRDFPWVNLPLVLVGLALSAWAAWRAFARPQVFRGRVLGSVGLAFSTLAAGFLCFYVFHLSSTLPPPLSTTLALETAPEFALADQLGATVRLSDYRGRKVVLVFFRGHW
jgi:hypothetical protein